MEQNVSNGSQLSSSSNRFIFSDEFYNQLDDTTEEVVFDIPKELPPNMQKSVEKNTNALNSTPSVLADSELESSPLFDFSIPKTNEHVDIQSMDSKPVSFESDKLEHTPLDTTFDYSGNSLSSAIETSPMRELSSFTSIQDETNDNNDADLAISNSQFDVETGINIDLEQEILKSKIEKPLELPIIENTNFYETPFQEKMVYRAQRNAPPTPIWLQGTEPVENNSSLFEPEQKPLLDVAQPQIINIDEKIEQQKEMSFSPSMEKSSYSSYDKDLSKLPVVKSNLLNELKEKESTTGKISILARYGIDFCSKDYITNPAIGRADEIKQLNLILLTPEKSAILVGKPGIGKTSIVEGLAYQLQRNNVPDAMKGYRVISIKTISLLGTLPSGETRLQTLIDELKELDKIILFIDEIHMLMGATDESGLDFANMFKESLGRGSIKMIGATTNDEYERYVLRDKAFVRRFQRVDVEEPTKEQTIEILIGTLPKIEQNTGAKLKYSKFVQSEIMAFIVDITTEYKRIYGIGSRYPDICLTLLSEAFSQAVFENRKEVNIYDIRNAIQNSKNIYPDVIRKGLTNFDNKFMKLIQGEN